MDQVTKKRLYLQMLRIRTTEERIAELYPEQEMRCPVHLCIGQEAVAVGVSDNLSRSDFVLSGHRSHGHYLAKGGDLRAMMAELYGRVTGCSMGKGGSMHLVDLEVGFLGSTPIVGSTIPIAVGAALGSVIRGIDSVTVAFFGDGAVEEGVFHESLNFAFLKQLPVVFVCENNFYSVFSPLEVRQPAGRDIFQLAQGHGMEAHLGDGNDVVQVYEMAGRAIHKARTGGGPTFLEFQTYRWREHVGPYYDHDLGYRSQEEWQAWQQKCPVRQLEEALLEQGVLAPLEIQAIRARMKADMEGAVQAAKAAPYPERRHVLLDVYAP